MGSDSPEQHILPTWSEHVERVQVRVAALAVRLGGFGTCAPGTWSSRAPAYGHARLIPYADRDGPVPEDWTHQTFRKDLRASNDSDVPDSTTGF